jgi:hypothetical protein
LIIANLCHDSVRWKFESDGQFEGRLCFRLTRFLSLLQCIG